MHKTTKGRQFVIRGNCFNFAKKYVFTFIAAICALTLCSFHDVADAGTTPAGITRPDRSLLEFRAGNHILGFAPDKAYLISMDHFLRVQFLGTRGVKPMAGAKTSTTGVMTKAPLFTRVIYPNLWKGISLTYEATKDGIVESTYNVAVGAAVSDIRMRYNVPVEVQKDGSLRIKFSRGYIAESAPRAWQEIDGKRRYLKVAFSAAHGEVGFTVGRYDHRHPLIIDPTYSWNTFYGGTATINYSYGLGQDSSGNIYMTGWSNSTWSGPQGEAPLNPYSNVNNLFVLKLDSAGGYLWHTFYGNGTGAQSIAVDGSGNVYVTGSSSNTWNGPSGELPLNSTGNIYILKLNTNGAYQWHTFYGNVGGYGIAVDTSGNVYVTGLAYYQWYGPAGQSPLNPYPGGNPDMFVLKLNSSGAYQWHTFYGSSGDTVGYGIGLDVDGNPVLTGYSHVSWNGPGGQSPLNPPTSDNQYVFVLKLNSDGAYQWHTFYGTDSGSAAGNAVATDGIGSIYVTGYANGSWNGASDTAPLNAYSGSSDIFVLKLDSSGGYKWHTFYGPSNGGYGIIVRNNHVYVAGYSYTTWDIGSAQNGGTDGIAILGLGGDGSYLWHHLYGSGSNQDTGRGIAVDDGGNIFVSGQGRGTWGTPLHDFSGSMNIFAMKLAASPTAVDVISFKATSYGNGVELRWKTGREVNNLGFHIYREEDGNLVRLTPDILAGSALMTGSGTTLRAGQSYTWWDDAAVNTDYSKIAGAKYWLEDIDLNGKKTWHGPVSPVLSPDQFPEKENPKLLYETGRRLAEEYRYYGRIQKLRERLRKDHPVQYNRRAKTVQGSSKKTEQAEVHISPVGRRASNGNRAMQEILAGMPAVKISVKEEGWYRVSQPELVAAGLSARVNPRYLELYADGIEQPIIVTGQKDGRFGPVDAIEFYGIGVDTPSTDTQVYWLIAGKTPGKRIRVFKGNANGRQTATQSFPFTVQRKDRTVYFGALLNGDADNFFGPVVTTEPVDEILSVSHPEPSYSGDALIEVTLQGVTAGPHRVNILFNDTNIGEVDFEGQTEGSAQIPVSGSLLREGDNLFTLACGGGETDVSLIDSIRLTYRHTYTADDNTLKFTVQGAGQVSVSGFGTPEIRVIDISDPQNPYEITGDITSGEGGYTVTFKSTGNGLKTLLAFDRDRIGVAEAIRPNQPSSWAQMKAGADFVIISHHDFLNSLSPLKALRVNQGLSVALIDIEDLYDEFSFGQKTPQAVKDFFIDATLSWNKVPRFVLFVGDSSFDPRNYLGLGDFDFVPTKLIDTQTMETASDDWFFDLKGDGLPEAAAGRIPVRTADEAAAVVSKIIGYEQTDHGSWRKDALLVADKDEGFEFKETAEDISTLLPSDMSISKIFRDDTDDVTARDELLAGLNQGALLVDYIGHGSVELWRGNLLTSEDALSLTNGMHLPFVVSMTCLNGLFHDVYTESLAEALLKAGQGGAVAVWASSGLTEPSGQAVMDRELIREIFDGDKPTLGEATVQAKASVSDMDIRRTWILFGDPATRLGY